MLVPYSDDMPHVATYWPRLGVNKNGAVQFGDPVQIMCRWQAKNDLYSDPQGRQRVSSAVVYPNRELKIEGRLALGEHADPFTDGAFVIVQQAASPDLDNDEVLIKVWL